MSVSWVFLPPGGIRTYTHLRNRLENRWPCYLRRRVYTPSCAILCCLGLPIGSPEDQPQAELDGATMRDYPAPPPQSLPGLRHLAVLYRPGVRFNRLFAVWGHFWAISCGPSYVRRLYIYPFSRIPRGPFLGDF